MSDLVVLANRLIGLLHLVLVPNMRRTLMVIWWSLQTRVHA